MKGQAKPILDVLFRGTLTALALTMPAGVAAQDAVTGVKSADAADAEIVVTAQRRSESKQTTPVSISAFSAEKLVQRGITSAADLQKLTPGVILSGVATGDNATFTIRGQSKAPIGPGLQSVITYINEVPLQSYGSSAPTFDLDNVQILKGPQGTAFGRNTTGGALLIYTAKPTSDLTGYLQIQGGNYDDREFQGAINLPVVADKLAIRIAGAIERRHGYTKNITTGADLNDKHSDALRVSVLTEPIYGIKNEFVFDYYTTSTNGPGTTPFQILSPALSPVLDRIPRGKVGSTTKTFINATYWGISNTTTLKLGAITFKNIFGYRSIKDDFRLDLLGLPAAALPDLGAPANSLVAPGAFGVYLDTNLIVRKKQITDEIQFSGTALDDKLNWLVGGFYLKDQPNGPNYLISDQFRPIAPTPTDLFIASLYGGAWPISSLADTFYTDESKSTFATATYDLSHLSPVLSGFKINAGVRRTWDKEGQCSVGRTVVSLVTSTPLDYPGLLATPAQSKRECGALPGSYSSSAKFSATTYTLGVDYKVSEDLFIYFTTRTGYRAGGINTPNLASSLSQFQFYKPQEVTDYEIGLHSKWQVADVSGRFNIAVYTDKYSALQKNAVGIVAGNVIGGVVITPENAPSNTSLTFNAGTATFRGVEADSSIVPVKGLSLGASVSYQTAKYNKLVAPAILLPYFSDTIDGAFSDLPKWSYQLTGQYQLPIEPVMGGAIRLNADYYHISSRFAQAVRLPAYGIADFSVEWRGIAGRQLELSLFINNAFNKRYIGLVSIGVPNFGAFSGAFGPPRMFGARLRYSLGN